MGLWGGQTMQDVLREAARTFICPPALVPKAAVMNNAQVCIYKYFFNSNDYIDCILG